MTSLKVASLNWRGESHPKTVTLAVIAGLTAHQLHWPDCQSHHESGTAVRGDKDDASASLKSRKLHGSCTAFEAWQSKPCRSNR